MRRPSSRRYVHCLRIVLSHCVLSLSLYIPPRAHTHRKLYVYVWCRENPGNLLYDTRSHPHGIQNFIYRFQDVSSLCCCAWYRKRVRRACLQRKLWGVVLCLSWLLLHIFLLTPMSLFIVSNSTHSCFLFKLEISIDWFILKTLSVTQKAWPAVAITECDNSVFLACQIIPIKHRAAKMEKRRGLCIIFARAGKLFEVPLSGRL